MMTRNETVNRHDWLILALSILVVVAPLLPA